jgi:hypothetical protein
MEMKSDVEGSNSHSHSESDLEFWSSFSQVRPT